MAEFMEGYGEKEARRGRLILRIAISVVAIAILATTGYFYFRTWSEERVFAHFKEALAKQDYSTGYGMWCNANKPCPYYSIEKFKDDWAAPSKYANIDTVHLNHVDYCGDGVVFSLSQEGADPIAIWVESSSGIMSFFPYQRSPGKRLQFGPFFRRLFGGAEKG